MAHPGVDRHVFRAKVFKPAPPMEQKPPSNLKLTIKPQNAGRRNALAITARLGMQ
jgi:hypothetical protein